MGSGSGFSDMLNFNSGSLRSITNEIIGIKDRIETERIAMKDIIEEQLGSDWKTENGIQTKNEMVNFLEQDLKSLVTYLEGRIEALESAWQSTLRINNL